MSIRDLRVEYFSNDVDRELVKQYLYFLFETDLQRTFRRTET